MTAADEKDNAVIIAFSADSAYVYPLCVTIESVVETGDPKRIYRIFVLHDSLTPQEIALLEGMGVRNTSVQCLNVGHLTDPEAMYVISYFPPASYYRLLIPEALPEYGKVLYLDCDTVVRKDVGILFDTELDGAVLGAARDEPGILRKGEIEKKLGLDFDRYFNSGVLLIDTNKYAAETVKERSLAFLRRNRRLTTPDQDALNVVCRGRVKLLDYRWNKFWGRVFDGSPHPDTEWILHYMSPAKPWNSVGFAQTEPFWRCARNTPVYRRLCSRILFRPLDRIEYIPLQEAILHKYRTGALGLRYIFRLIWAWLAFKLFGKPESGEI